MKVILHDKVDGIGDRGEIVDVANGYFRNYLGPRGLAQKATEGAAVHAEAMRRVSAQRSEADRVAAEEIATRLVPTVITIAATAGDAGKLFGSVTSADIVAAVKEQTDIEIDRRALTLEHPLKDLGTHMVMAKLHAEIEFPITVEVAAAEG